MTAADWEMFQDWCAATGNVALPTTWATVQSFLENVPAAPHTMARRLGAIRARHECARQELVGAPARPRVPTPWRTPGELVDEGDSDGPCWLGLGEALHQLPVYGWPHAVTARRDAVILALAERGWSRRQITDLRSTQIRLEPVPAVDDIDLPMTNHGLTCPSCALTRWLRVLAAVYADTDGAWESVAMVVEDQPVDVRQHDCGTPLTAGWERAPWVLPSIDGHGRVQLGSRLPARRVSAVLAIRQRAPVTAIEEAPHAQEAPPKSPPSLAERAATVHAIDDALDELDSAIDAAVARWNAVLDRSDSSVITDNPCS